MKNLLFLALMACFTLVSCEEVALTGDLVINAGGVGSGEVGVFDPIVLTDNSSFRVRNALRVTSVDGSTRITGLNPGNYICAEINSSSNYVSFQITAGEVRTIDINL